MFPDDPPTFMSAVPHGYADPDVFAADVPAGGLRCEAITPVTLEGTAASAADLASGYCGGTPLLAEITARGDHDVDRRRRGGDERAAREGRSAGP